jgi:hypothetical protein
MSVRPEFRVLGRFFLSIGGVSLPVLGPAAHAQSLSPVLPRKVIGEPEIKGVLTVQCSAGVSVAMLG